MMSRSKIRVSTVTSYDDHNGDNADVPHDERFPLTMKPKDERSITSNCTYGQKQPTSQWSSAPKRSARKAPYNETDLKFTNHRISSAQSLPTPPGLIKSYIQKSALEDISGSQLVLGVPSLRPASVTSTNSQIADALFSGHLKQQLPISRPPSGLNSMAAGNHSWASARTGSSGIHSRASTRIHDGNASVSSIHSSNSGYEYAPVTSVYRQFENRLPISRPRSSSNSKVTGSHSWKFTQSIGSDIHPRTCSGIHEGNTSSSSLYSSKSRFENASESSLHRKCENRTPPPTLCESERNVPLDIARILDSVTLKTKISSLTGPSAFSSNTSTSDMASTRSSRSGNSRSILNERYQKKYNRSFTKKDFVTIRDTRDGDHVPTFTSVFVCPETRECFLSGDLLEGDFVQDRDGMKWYKKKATAEFAAAGRAEDCLRFRSGDSHGGDQFCAEEPTISIAEAEEEIEQFLNACPKAREGVAILRNRRLV